MQNACDYKAERAQSAGKGLLWGLGQAGAACLGRTWTVGARESIVQRTRLDMGSEAAGGHCSGSSRGAAEPERRQAGRGQRRRTGSLGLLHSQTHMGWGLIPEQASWGSSVPHRTSQTPLYAVTGVASE